MRKSSDRYILLGVFLLGMFIGGGTSYFIFNQSYENALNVFINYEINEYEDLSISTFSNKPPSSAIQYQKFFIKILETRYKASWISESDYKNKVGLSYARTGYLYKVLNDSEQSGQNVELALEFLAGAGNEITETELMNVMSSLHNK